MLDFSEVLSMWTNMEKTQRNVGKCGCQKIFTDMLHCRHRRFAHPYLRPLILVEMHYVQVRMMRISFPKHTFNFMLIPCFLLPVYEHTPAFFRKLVCKTYKCRTINTMLHSMQSNTTARKGKQSPHVKHQNLSDAL